MPSGAAEFYRAMTDQSWRAQRFHRQMRFLRMRWALLEPAEAVPPPGHAATVSSSVAPAALLRQG